MPTTHLLAASFVVCLLQAACAQEAAQAPKPGDDGLGQVSAETTPEREPAVARGGVAGAGPTDTALDAGAGAPLAGAGTRGPGASPADPGTAQGTSPPSTPPIVVPDVVSLDFAALPYVGQVSGDGIPAPYQLNGLTAGTTYLATLESQGAPMAFHVLYSPCHSGGAEGLVAHQAFTAEDSSFELRILANFVEPAGFVLRVAVAEIQPEGTAAAPVTLTLDDLPYSATAPCASPNHYVITGLDPEQGWLFELRSPGWAFLRTFDSPAGTLDCEDLTDIDFDARCQAVAPFSEVHLTVVAHSIVEQSFTLGAMPVSYVDEGTVEEPLELALVELPHAGSVSRKGLSVYLVTGLSPDTAYDVSLAEAADVGLRVTAPETELGLCSDASGTDAALHPIGCSATPTGSTMRIETWGYENAGTPYSLSVVPR